MLSVSGSLGTSTGMHAVSYAFLTFAWLWWVYFPVYWFTAVLCILVCMNPPSLLCPKLPSTLLIFFFLFLYVIFVLSRLLRIWPARFFVFTALIIHFLGPITCVLCFPLHNIFFSRMEQRWLFLFDKHVECFTFDFTFPHFISSFMLLLAITLDIHVFFNFFAAPSPPSKSPAQTLYSFNSI